MHDGDRLLAAALAHPRDWDRLMVYANWLEEHGVSGSCGECGGGGCPYCGPGGDYHTACFPCPACNGTGRTDAAAEALGWRLLAGARRWPLGGGRRTPKYWWCRESPGYRVGVEGNVLPAGVWDKLAGERDGHFMKYVAVPAALADAARAFGLAWLAGWRPAPCPGGAAPVR